MNKYTPQGLIQNSFANQVFSSYAILLPNV